MERFIFEPLGASLLNIPPYSKQYNTFVERFHRTDGEEFYIPNFGSITAKKAFFRMAQQWVLCFNYQRPHFGRGMKGCTPLEALSASGAAVHPAVCAFPVVYLDVLSSHVNSFWDISGIPWDNSPKNKKEGLVNETLEHYKGGKVTKREGVHPFEVRPLHPVEVGLSLVPNTCSIDNHHLALLLQAVVDVPYEELATSLILLAR